MAAASGRTLTPLTMCSLPRAVLQAWLCPLYFFGRLKILRFWHLQLPMASSSWLMPRARGKEREAREGEKDVESPEIEEQHAPLQWGNSGVSPSLQGNDASLPKVKWVCHVVSWSEFSMRSTLSYLFSCRHHPDQRRSIRMERAAVRSVAVLSSARAAAPIRSVPAGKQTPGIETPPRCPQNYMPTAAPAAAATDLPITGPRTCSLSLGTWSCCQMNGLACLELDLPSCIRRETHPVLGRSFKEVAPPPLHPIKTPVDFPSRSCRPATAAAGALRGPGKNCCLSCDRRHRRCCGHSSVCQRQKCFPSSH